jgi:hypothetical protein
LFPMSNNATELHLNISRVQSDEDDAEIARLSQRNKQKIEAFKSLIFNFSTVVKMNSCGERRSRKDRMEGDKKVPFCIGTDRAVDGELHNGTNDMQSIRREETRNRERVKFFVAICGFLNCRPEKSFPPTKVSFAVDVQISKSGMSRDSRAIKTFLPHPPGKKWNLDKCLPNCLRHWVNFP